MKRNLFLKMLCAAAMILFVAGERSSAQQNYSTDLDALKREFNEAKGKVRIVLLLSPTCPACTSGASEVHTAVLEKIADKTTRVFTVWVPILEKDKIETVPNAVKLMPDRRVKHFWDANGELVKSYARVLGFKAEQPAWDVYFAYDREAVWKDAPPSPTYWMTKLKAAPERKFDAEAFRAAVEKLIAASRKLGASTNTGEKKNEN